MPSPYSRNLYAVAILGFCILVQAKLENAELSQKPVPTRASGTLKWGQDPPPAPPHRKDDNSRQSLGEFLHRSDVDEAQQIHDLKEEHLQTMGAAPRNDYQHINMLNALKELRRGDSNPPASKTSSYSRASWTLISRYYKHTQLVWIALAICVGLLVLRLRSKQKNTDNLHNKPKHT